VGPNESVFAFVSCNPGEFVLGGGVQFVSGDTNSMKRMEESFPTYLSDRGVWGWQLLVNQTLGVSSSTFRAFAVCVTP
jgi:hypothetical protein